MLVFLCVFSPKLLAMLAVALLAVTVYGHPTTDFSSESFIEPIAKKTSFVRGCLNDIKTSVIKHTENIKDGFGVVTWVKNKFGLSTEDTDVEPRSTPYNYVDSSTTSAKPTIVVYPNENNMISSYGQNYVTTEENLATTEANYYEYQSK